MKVFWIEILCIFQLNGQKGNRLVQWFLEKEKNMLILRLCEEKMPEYYPS